ncbi:TPA: alpha-2,8-polysialyltransferase family protein [Neisseria meningitidis]
MLKKIKKALFQPKKFFQDSMWLTTSPFYLTPPRNNLFVISNLGQLNQVQSLIKIQKLTNNLLVILYTSKNLKMPKLVHQSANKNLFESIYLFELPRSPNNITPKKLLYIYRSYKKILNIIQPAHLYMLSFTGHYSYLISIAKKKNITTHLIDEGTGTYAPLLESFSYHPTKLERYLIGNNLNIKGYIDHFDILHVPFPEYAKKIFNAKKYNRFFAHAGGISINNNIANLQKKYQISKNDYIFVSQRYPISDDLYYKSIVEILNSISLQIKGKIFIKLHPKEMGNNYVMSLFLNMVEINPRLVVINEPPFLIEPLIYLTNPKGIIGLASSSLIYTPLLSPSTQCLSIGELIINLIQKYSMVENTEMIQEHLEIIKKLNFINILNDLNGVISNPLFKTEETFETLLKSAEFAYKSKNYFQAIFYWQLASKNNITLLGHKALWYYNALYNVKQIYKMEYSDIFYIDNISVDFHSKDKLTWEKIKHYYYSADNRIGRDR